ncbi:acyl carrier protein [Adhaeretor mobilis]|uniref:Acyl carrier protein n=1 Tax=Adhaeretor mobilis TaxID=1930276 RepID=A0A517N1M4_9BACT|nr:hypothetical protein [Adhaeretor mobilis]QDT01036.1 acyl carrier protein [Adhaeretor mobilis]
MGLDFQEIVLEIEEQFHIALDDEEVQGLVKANDIRVGDLYDLILGKLGLQDQTRNSVTLNAALWRKMQFVLAEVTKRPATEVSLQTSMADLFPRETRRQDWCELKSVSPFRIRELDYAPPFRVLAFLITAGVAYIELHQLWQFPAARWLWPLLGLLGLWIFLETHLKILTILSSLRNYLPSRMLNVKDLCRDVLASDYEQVCRHTEVAIDENCLAVWNQLVEILVHSLGVEADEVNFRSLLIRDLDMA